MKKITVICLTSATIGIGAIPALAEVDPKIHKLCIEAKDYAGCVKSMNSQSESANATSETDEKCWGNGLERICLAKGGMDNLGMPKLIGWFYQYGAGGNIQYYEADLERTMSLNEPKFKRYFIPHKGQKRYIGLKSVNRVFVNAKPGYSGSSTTIGSASTSCSTYGGQTFCNTTPALTINIPGRSSQPAKIDTAEGLIVSDCKEQTVGVYFREGKGVKWHKQTSEACSDIPFEELEVLNFKL